MVKTPGSIFHVKASHESEMREKELVVGI